MLWDTTHRGAKVEKVERHFAPSQCPRILRARRDKPLHDARFLSAG